MYVTWNITWTASTNNNAVTQVVLTGPSLPPETPSEHTTSIMVSSIKRNQELNIKESDISITHKLEPHEHQRNWKIIVKLMNRSLKQDLISVYIQLKLKIYINESLTPKCRIFFNAILGTRREHRSKFQP